MIATKEDTKALNYDYLDMDGRYEKLLLENREQKEVIKELKKVISALTKALIKEEI